MGAVDDVVSTIGLWWPEADEDAVREAAAAWQRASVELDRAVAVGHQGVTQAHANWNGEAADRFEQAWREHETTLRDDSAARLALADACSASPTRWPTRSVASRSSRSPRARRSSRASAWRG